MIIDVKKEKNKQIDIEITIDDFIVKKHLKIVATDISKKANIPGFRKGKVPYNIIESQYGKDYILENSLDPIIQEVIPGILEEQKLEYPCAPKVDILEREPKLKIILMVPLKPEIDLGDINSLTSKIKKEKITKNKIEETINRILESRSTWGPSKSPLDLPGFAKLNISGKFEDNEIINEKDFDFYAAENSPLVAPGISENIKGIKKGEKKSFLLTLPLDWKEEEYKGKNINFIVECLEIQEKIIPKLDKDFLKELNPEIKDLKEFEEQIKTEITSENEYKYNMDMENQAIDDMIKISKFKISEIHIQRSTDHVIEDRMKSISQYRMSLEDYLKAINKTNEEFYNEAKDLSEKELKKLLIIDEIIKNENIKASKKDIENEINSIKEQYKGQELADDETLFSIVENNIKRRNSIEHLIKISKSSDKNRKK
jgi:trigger factor